MSDRELGPKIAEGRTAEVFAWGDDRVLKLYRAEFERRQPERELRLGQRLQELDLPAPAAYSVEEVDGRYGVVFERVDGETMLQVLAYRLWRLRSYGRQLAELQWEIHQQPGEGLPDLHERLGNYLASTDNLSESQRERGLAIFERLPRGDRLCHADFHPDNVLMAKSGPVIIDWESARCGNPLADFSQTRMELELAALPPHLPLWQKGLARTLRSSFARLFARRYLQLAQPDRHEVEGWTTLTAVARLGEGIPEERALLLERVRTRLGP